MTDPSAEDRRRAEEINPTLFSWAKGRTGLGPPCLCEKKVTGDLICELHWQIALALAQARAEGRREGLEEAISRLKFKAIPGEDAWFVDLLGHSFLADPETQRDAEWLAGQLNADIAAALRGRAGEAP